MLVMAYYIDEQLMVWFCLQGDPSKMGHSAKLGTNVKFTIFLQTSWNLVNVTPHEKIQLPKFHIFEENL